MSTFGDLKEIVARDLDRYLEQLHGEEIGEAIDNAIQFYQHERFWTLEYEDNSLATIDKQPNYPKPAELASIHTIEITVSNSTYPLDVRTWEWYTAIRTTLSTNGQPTDYATYADEIWLYPVPDRDGWPLTIWGTQQLDTLSADDDTNAWMIQPSRQLIRAAAKADVFGNCLDLPQQAAFQEAVANRWLRKLRARTSAEVATSKVTPTYF